MKRKINNLVNHFGLTCLMLAAFMWGVGCAAPKSTPDPLAGWNLCISQDPNKLSSAINDDYQYYLQELPVVERTGVGPVQFFVDGTGQHAVRIEIALNGIDWAHVLIYDKENKRVKVLKFVSGHYRS